MNLFTEDLHNVVTKILANVKNSDSEIFKELTIEPDFYKVQDQYYGGNGIHFNFHSETRFSLSSKSKGVMYLAEVLSNYADGMEYLSRHTGKPCIVLWSSAVDGNGILKNLSVTPLSQYNHNGRNAQKILKSQLGIYIV